MTTQSGFYRSYRPQKFATVIGQDVITSILKQQIANDRNHYAYLFAGLHGTGKTSTARIFARAINCLANERGEPCDKCKICVKNTNRHHDIIEIDAASNNGVEQIRALQEKAFLAPLESRKKIYIIDEVHMLSKSAYNAFLKLLEEPPKHVVFILATTEIYKIPATILSRCQIYRFNPVTPDKLAAALKEIAQKEHIPVETEVLHEIAKAAQGSVRDALNILEQGSLLLAGGTFTLAKLFQQLGRAAPDTVFRFLSGLMNNNKTEALDCCEQMTKENTNYTTLISSIIQEINGLVYAHYKPSAVTNSPAQQNWPVEKLEVILKIFLKNATKPNNDISNLTALQLLVWETLQHLFPAPVTTTKNLEQPTPKATAKPLIPSQPKPPTAPVTSFMTPEQLIDLAVRVLKNRSPETTNKIKVQWNNLDNYIGHPNTDPFIKLLLTTRLVSASKTHILLEVNREENVKTVQKWNKQPEFSSWLATTFAGANQIVPLNPDLLEIVKMRFKNHSE